MALLYILYLFTSIHFVAMGADWGAQFVVRVGLIDWRSVLYPNNDITTCFLL